MTDLIPMYWVGIAFIVGAVLMWAGCSQQVNVMSQQEYGQVVEMILNDYLIVQPRQAERLIMELNEYTNHSKEENELSYELRSFIKKVEYINGDNS